MTKIIKAKIKSRVSTLVTNTKLPNSEYVIFDAVRDNNGKGINATQL